VVADSPGRLRAARLGQGAAASAFSPAASALVSRLNPAVAGAHRRRRAAPGRPRPRRRPRDQPHRPDHRPDRDRGRAARRDAAGLAGLLVAAVLVGAGTGLITPLGFAALAVVVAAIGVALARTPGGEAS
jgi:hypothetical protein